MGVCHGCGVYVTSSYTECEAHEAILFSSSLQPPLRPCPHPPIVSFESTSKVMECSRVRGNPGLGPASATFV